MKRVVTTCVIAALIVVLLAVSASARLGLIVPDLKWVVQQGKAEVICVGEFVGSSVGPRDRLGGASIEILFRVDRVIKGKVTPGSQLTIEHYEDSVARNGAVFNPREYTFGYRLVMLNQDAGSYHFALPSFSTMPVSSQPSPSYRQSDDIYANLRAEMVHSLADDSQTVVEDALQQSALLCRDDLVAYVKPLTDAKDVRIKAAALAAYLGSGDDSALPKALNFLQQTSPKGERDTVIGPVIDLLGKIHEVEITDANVEMMARALKSPSVELREAACYAMRQSGKPSVLPHLKQALDDSDPQVRYDAMMGLAKATGDKRRTPTISEYMSKPRAYKADIDYWKNKSLH